MSGETPRRWLATIVVLFVSWRLPCLGLLAQDSLVTAPGCLATPDEVVIVAIDEPSLKRFGRFPCSWQIMAQAIERITAAQPKVIILRLLYSDPTNVAADTALAGGCPTLLVEDVASKSSGHSALNHVILLRYMFRHAP